MAKRDKRFHENFDALEFSYGADFDVELFDDIADDEIPETDATLAAWRRIELRQESQWLRNQVLDWDEYFETQ